MGQRFVDQNQKFDMGNYWHFELGVFLSGNLRDELSLMITYLMDGLLDKGIKMM